MRRVAPLLLASLAVLSTGCAGLRDVSGMVLARVNDEPITVRQLEESFTSSHRGHGVLLAGQGAVRQFLEKVIDKRLLAQEARRIGLDRTPEIARVREEVRRRRARERLYNDEVLAKLEVPAEAITTAWDRLGFRVTARHILVDSQPEAQRARDRVRAGEEFGEVARAVSQSPTASRGGDLGIVQSGRLDPSLEDVLWALAKGEVSAPFETEEGWNLLLVTERVTVERPKLEAVRPRLVARLTQQERQRRAEALLAKLSDAAGAVIHAAKLVEALKAPEGAGPPAATPLIEAGAERVTLGEILPRIDVAAARTLPSRRLERQLRWLLREELLKILLTREGLARGYGDRPEVVREVNTLTDTLIVDELAGRVILADVRVTDAEAEAYYRANPPEFTEPEAVKLNAIVVETEEDAHALRGEIRAGKPLGALARRASKDPTLAASGGEVGWVTRGQLDAEVERLAFSLAAGATGLVKGKAGWVVVQVEDKREPRLRPFAEVVEQARQRALRQRSQEAVKRWVDTLRAASTIAIDDEAIARAIASYEAEARRKAGKP